MDAALLSPIILDTLGKNLNMWFFFSICKFLFNEKELASYLTFLNFQSEMTEECVE